MRALTYLEIRHLVRSGQIGLDVNPYMFNQPNYKTLPIVTLDLNIKNFSFDSMFLDIINTSMQSSTQDKLIAATKINVKACLSPQKPLWYDRSLKGWKKLYNNFKNYIYHTPHIDFKPRSMQVIPLSISIREQTLIPKLVTVLTEELANKGLVVVNTIPSYAGQETSFVTIYNSSGSTVRIKNLETLGTIRLMYDGV